MTATEFQAFLAEMKAAGIAKNNVEAAKVLGVHSNTVLNWKQLGTGSDLVGYAATAIMLRMKPWPQNPFGHEKATGG